VLIANVKDIHNVYTVWPNGKIAVYEALSPLVPGILSMLYSS